MATYQTPISFTVGSLTPGPSRPLRVIESADELEHVQEGEWLSRWGWLMEWTDGCIRPSELENFRHRGDPACDAVVRHLELSTGQDGLQKLLDYTSSVPEEHWADCIREFWRQVRGDPPEEVDAFARPATNHSCNGIGDGGNIHSKDQKKGKQSDVRKVYTPENAIKGRNRHPEPTLEEGQAVFWRYSVDMFHSLLHFSLAAGFASARIMSVLHETGYLTSSSRDATYRRLMETTQALVDYMSDMTPLTGKGWQSAVRVRMLHSQVRQKILANKGKLKTYSVEQDGEPINQEDLLATLGAFCMAPLWCQKRLKIFLTPQEEAAYISAWRHVGYYLGIEPALLKRFFSPPSNNTDTCHRFFACISFHLYAEPETPKDPFSTSTYKILHAVADRPPQMKSTLYHCELSRALLGPGLSDQLSLPRGTSRDKIGVLRHQAYSWIQSHFARYYRSAWDLRRQELFRTVIKTLVAWQLGEKRSKYTWKEAGDHDKKISQLDKAVYGDEGEDSGLQFGQEVGIRLRREGRRIFIEMGVVILGVGLLGLGASWQAVRYVRLLF